MDVTEVAELDKSGNIQRKWLHTQDDRIIPV